MSSSSPLRWTRRRPRAGTRRSRGWSGSTMSSYACNTTEWWQEESFQPDIMDRELGWAAEIGYNTTRVFLQYLVWKHNPGGFKARFDRFLSLAQRHGISVMPVLFDDCTFGEPKQLDPFLGEQRPPIPGMILPSWTPSPGRRLGTDPAEQPALREYVQDMLRSFGGDRRVLAWDLFNEPMNVVGVGQPDFLRGLFGGRERPSPASRSRSGCGTITRRSTRSCSPIRTSSRSTRTPTPRGWRSASRSSSGMAIP